MIKGINHSVIEVNETGNEYYERAILIIKPEYASAQRAVLEDEAKKLLRELDVPSAVRSRKRRIKLIAMGAVLFLAGMLAGILCIFL